MVLERRARGPARGPWSKKAPDRFGVWGAVLQGALVKRAPGGLEATARRLLKKGPWWFWGLKGGSTKGWSKRAPGGFGASGLQEAPGQKGPLVVLGVGRGVLQEAPGQKGPLVVLERRARGPPRGPWSKKAPDRFGVWGAVLQGALVKRPPGGLEATARRLLKKGPWWFWGLKGGSTKGWSKRALGGFGA